jgi:2-succinyl-6-hydroxy-2,4-cyclohexadiene-1-carboxylate synthase
MKPLVLLHGFTGTPASFDELTALLRADTGALRVLCPSILGHGADAAGVETFEGEIDRLATQIRAAGFAGAHLCGYSMGARLALGLLAREPGLFSGATLIGVHPGLTSSTERSERRTSDERWCRLLQEQGLATFIRAWQAQPTFQSQATLDDPRAAPALARQHEIRSAHRPEELARALRVLGLAEMPDYRSTLDTTPMALTLVVGAEDTKFLALGQSIVLRSKSTRLEIIADAGHNVVLEAPARLAAILGRAVAA